MTNLNIVYEWNTPSSQLRSILEGVSPTLYDRIDFTIVMSGVRLPMTNLTLAECLTNAENYHDLYLSRINRRY